MPGDRPTLVIRERDPDFRSLLAEAISVLEVPERIVLCSGCFDLLHPGHRIFLEAASAAGDVVVVAMNSDASVRMLKGPDRPIKPEGDRAHALAALPMVDLVVIAEGRDARVVIRALRPDAFVVGESSEAEHPEEAAEARMLGADVLVVERRGDVSTTRIVQELGDGRDPSLPGEGASSPVTKVDDVAR